MIGRASKIGRLAVAAIDRLTEQLLAPGATGAIEGRLRHWTAGVDRAQPALVLDVGCGSLSRLVPLNAAPIAVDISHARVAAARANGATAVVASADALPFLSGSFTIAASVGLLHHMPDRSASDAIREMTRVTASGGRTVVVDAVLPESAPRKPLAWLIRRLDRGGCMRGQMALEQLFESPAAWRRERMTYARTGLEALVMARNKE